MSQDNNSAELRDFLILVGVGIGLIFLGRALLGSGVVFWVLGVALAIGAYTILTHPMEGITNGGLKAGFKLVAVAIAGIWIYMGINHRPYYDEDYFKNYETEASNYVPKSKVYIDNFTEDDVHVYVKLDSMDSLLTSLNSKGKTVLSIPKGDYTFIVKVKESGKRVDSIVSEVNGYKKYIMNCGGAETYYQGKAVYGSKLYVSQHEEEEKEIRDHWFSVSVQHLFEDPPNTVTVYGGMKYATRSYLVRGTDVLEDYLDGEGSPDLEKLLQELRDARGDD